MENIKKTENVRPFASLRCENAEKIASRNVDLVKSYKENYI